MCVCVCVCVFVCVALYVCILYRPRKKNHILHRGYTSYNDVTCSSSKHVAEAWKVYEFFYLSDGPGCHLRRASGRSSSAPDFSCYPKDWYRWRSPLFFPAVIKHSDQYAIPTLRLWSISPRKFQTDMIFVF